MTIVPPNNQLALLAAAFGMPNFRISSRLKKRFGIHECVQCGKKIPPGKPNRKCKACREE